MKKADPAIAGSAFSYKKNPGEPDVFFIYWEHSTVDLKNALKLLRFR